MPYIRAGVEKESLKLNVGGVLFSIPVDSLDAFPYSRLCRIRDCRNSAKSIRSLCDDFDSAGNVYYFDRDPDAFGVLRVAYKKVPIHMPRSMCPIRLTEEKTYWGVEDAPLDLCCKERYQAAASFVGDLNSEVDRRLEATEFSEDKAKKIFNKVHHWKDVINNLSKIRWLFWQIFEYPSSSVWGKAWAITSVIFIVLSLSTFAIGTLEFFQDFTEGGVEIENPVIAVIEKICIGWFTLEYVLRLIAAPEKLRFIRQFLNLIDLVTIIPFYVQLYVTHSSSSDQNLESVSHLMQVFRIMRVMRVFRLGRHSAGLQVLCKTFIRSSTELALLSMYLVMGIVMLATIEYSIEEETFPHLGEAFWWATITVTTVGYGDICPTTIPGKLVAAMAFLIGVFAIGLPIHPIIANFTHFYKKSAEIECAYKRSMKRKDVELENMKDSTQITYCDNEESPCSTRGRISKSPVILRRRSSVLKKSYRVRSHHSLGGSISDPRARWKRAISTVSGSRRRSMFDVVLNSMHSDKVGKTNSLPCQCMFCT